MFAAEFEPAKADGRRISPRAPVSLDAGLGKGGLGRALCKVLDVSLHGVRLSTYSMLARGSIIWLMLPRLGHVAAEVRWADDFIAGCRFQKPLTKTQLYALLGDEQAGRVRGRRGPRSGPRPPHPMT